MEISVEKNKPWKKQFASFLKEPTRINLRNLLNLEAVEDNDLEFKRELLQFDVLAKHILAMANKNGGAIVFGVEETQANQFSPCGLDLLGNKSESQARVYSFYLFSSSI